MISVIIPAYNAAGFLPACLAALRQQTHPPDEIIVVDDGSTDSTAEAAQALGARVISILHSGPAAARNAGIQAARGNVVMFTDADCQPTPEWAAELARSLSDPGVSGVKGTYLTHQREVVARLAQCEFEERYALLERSVVIDFVDSHSAAFRVAVLRQMGGFDPAFPQANNEDVDLSYRLSQAGYKLVFNRRATVCHHHRSGWWDYLRLKASRGYWRMIVYRLHPNKALRDSYTPQSLKAQIVLAGLAGLMTGLSAIWPPMFWGVTACLGVLLMTAIPFMKLVASKDPGLLPWTPLFVVGRALAFLVGVVGGAIGMFFFRPARTGLDHTSGPTRDFAAITDEAAHGPRHS